jgi:beta-ureidopropionase / N-carbamoyl-L-amino-acid hydrolase
MTEPSTPTPQDRLMVSEMLDAARLWQRLAELARHGATPAGGVERLALSPAEVAARHAVLGWAAAAGLGLACDPAGNIFLRLEGRSASAAPVLTGSYLDSQPKGGRYSGSYGVLAGLEALCAIGRAGHAPERPIVAAIWTNGEGSRFCPGYTGSKAFAARRLAKGSLAVRDDTGASFGEALSAWQATAGGLAKIRLGFDCSAYVELHLEQGPELEDRNKQIGVVTGMQGMRRYQIDVEGEAAHAGGMPRARRRDALSAAVRIIGGLESVCSAPDVTHTVSQLAITPNAPSVVPGSATFSLDVRHADDTVLTHLGEAIRLICQSEKGPCRCTLTEVLTAPPITFDPLIGASTAAAAARLGLTTWPMLSLGGHDARSLAGHCPSGIIFIPCHKGISHSEHELISSQAATGGARVLTDVLWDFANA